MTDQINTKKRNKVLLIVGFFLFNIILFFIYFFIKVSALANFSINDSNLFQNNIPVLVDRLPVTVNFISHSEKTKAYQWRINKINNTDTVKYSVKSFVHSFDEVGEYIVELKAFGKKGEGDDVKIKNLTLVFSELYKDKVAEIFESVFADHLKLDYDSERFLNDSRLRGGIDTNQIVLTYYNTKGRKLSESDLVRKIRKGNYKISGFENCQFNDKGELTKADITITFVNEEKPSPPNPADGADPVVIQPTYATPSDNAGVQPAEEVLPDSPTSTFPKEGTKKTDSEVIQQPKGSDLVSNDCKSGVFNLPETPSKINTKNLNPGTKVLTVNESYKYSYQNDCKEVLKWDFHGDKKKGREVDYIFSTKGRKKICLSENNCKEVIVSYDIGTVENAIEKILIAFQNKKNPSGLVEDFNKMIEDPKQRGTINFERQQLTIEEWLGKVAINKPEKLNISSFTVDTQTGRIKRIDF